jgi:hypothetical protein
VAMLRLAMGIGTKERKGSSSAVCASPNPGPPTLCEGVRLRVGSWYHIEASGGLGIDW